MNVSFFPFSTTLAGDYVDPPSILQTYNGRLNLIEEPTGVRFQMSEKMAVKNKATEYRNPLLGITEDNLLARTYFSEANIQILQNGLRAGVYRMSENKIVVAPQNIDQLKIIMRSIYLQYAEYSDEPIAQQIKKLNDFVLDYAVKSVHGEAIGYLKYLEDQSRLVMPLAQPQQADRDYKELSFDKWF